MSFWEWIIGSTLLIALRAAAEILVENARRRAKNSSMNQATSRSACPCDGEDDGEDTLFAGSIGPDEADQPPERK
jgi:hypothetical protein